jgi:DNA repair photolyase
MASLLIHIKGVNIGVGTSMRHTWLPDFFDKIYAKSNACEVLEKELKTGKHEMIDPFMVSSATDPHQPAELKYNLTQKCRPTSPNLMDTLIFVCVTSVRRKRLEVSELFG